MQNPEVVGSYAVCDEIATGGMATVHLGRLLGPEGFSRVVAIKKLHPQFAKDPEFLTMFLDEARIVAPIRHPNVVQTLDILESDDGLVIVMDYVHGETLARLIRAAKAKNERMPLRIACSIMANVCLGLHAAHEVRSPTGAALEIVHRDISPQNIIVSTDGAASVLDFGVAKAEGRLAHTREGEIKGKIAYMAPEQLRGEVDRRTDIFACGIVLWELACGRRMFEGAGDADILTRLMTARIDSPSKYVPDLPRPLVECIMKALHARPSERFGTAKELALAIESAIGIAAPSEVGEWVERMASERLTARAAIVSRMEQATRGLAPRPLATRGLLDSLSQQASRKPADLSVEVKLDSEPPRGPDRVDTLPVPGAPRPPAVAPQSGSHPSMARPPHAPVGTSSAVVVPEAAPSTGRTGAQPAPSSRGLYVALALMALLGVILLVVGVARRTIANDPTPQPSQSVAPTTPPQPSVTAAPSTTTGSIPSAGSSAPAPSTTASSAGVPSTTTTATARPVVLPTTPKPPKPSCDPPYTVDDKGHRHYKPECD